MGQVGFKAKINGNYVDSEKLNNKFIVSGYLLITAAYSLTVSESRRVCGHGGLLAGVSAHLYVLSVRGGEEGHRCGQRNQEDTQAAEEEGDKGN